jgi:hypothetical protein
MNSWFDPLRGGSNAFLPWLPRSNSPPAARLTLANCPSSEFNFCRDVSSACSLIWAWQIRGPIREMEHICGTVRQQSWRFRFMSIMNRYVLSFAGLYILITLQLFVGIFRASHSTICHLELVVHKRIVGIEAGGSL